MAEAVASQTIEAAPTPATETPAAPAQTAAEAATEQAATTPAQTQAAPESPKVPEKDEIADGMAELNRMRRELQRKHGELSSKEKEQAARLEFAGKFESARQAFVSKDYAAALAALAGDDGFDLDEASVLLLEQASKRDAKPLTQADIERIAAEKFKAEQEAAAKAAEERNRASLEESKAMFGETCADEFKANAAKYPLIASRGVTDEAIFGWVLPQIRARGGVAPSPAEVMQHFEGMYMRQFEAEARAMGYSKAEIAAAKQEMKDAASAGQSPKLPAVPSLDTRGAATEKKDPNRKETLAEMDARHRAALRAS